MFSRRPDITWKYLAQIENNCRHAGPNAAHRAIARFEERLPEVLVFYPERRRPSSAGRGAAT